MVRLVTPEHVVREADRQAIWHRIVPPTPAEIGGNATAAFKASGLDYDLRLDPMATPEGATWDVERRMVVRPKTAEDPTDRILGVVSDRYEIVQNRQIAAALDPILARNGWTIDTAGDIGHGARMFVSINTGEQRIAGEDYKGYLVIGDTRNGGSGGQGRSLSIMSVPFRMQCANALNIAFRKAQQVISVRHARNIEYQFAAALLDAERIRAEQAAVTEALEILAQTRITEVQAQHIIDAAYPLPPTRPGHQHVAIDPTVPLGQQEAARRLRERFGVAKVASNVDFDALEARARSLRLTGAELYDRFNQAHGRLAGTAYGAFQTVVELTDHRSKSERNARSAFLGSGVEEKSRAFRAALALTK